MLHENKVILGYVGLGLSKNTEVQELKLQAYTLTIILGIL